LGLWDGFFLAAKREFLYTDLSSPPAEQSSYRYIEGVKVLYGTNTVHLRSKTLLDSLPTLILPQQLSVIPGLEVVWSVDTHEHRSREAPRKPEFETILQILERHFPSLSNLHLGIKLGLPIVQVINRRPTLQRVYLDEMLKTLDEFIKRRRCYLRKPFILSITTSAWRDLEQHIRMGGYTGMDLLFNRIWRYLDPSPRVGGHIQVATADEGYWIWRGQDAIRRSMNSIGRGNLPSYTQ